MFEWMRINFYNTTDIHKNDLEGVGRAEKSFNMIQTRFPFDLVCFQGRRAYF